jgi:hypothetical protein
MSGIADHGTLFGECFQGVTRNEPCSFDVVLVEKLQHSSRAVGSSPKTTRDITGAVFTSIATQPTSNGVDVNSI